MCVRERDRERRGGVESERESEKEARGDFVDAKVERERGTRRDREKGEWRGMLFIPTRSDTMYAYLTEACGYAVQGYLAHKKPPPP